MGRTGPGPVAYGFDRAGPGLGLEYMGPGWSGPWVGEPVANTALERRQTGKIDHFAKCSIKWGQMINICDYRFIRPKRPIWTCVTRLTYNFTYDERNCDEIFDLDCDQTCDIDFLRLWHVLWAFSLPKHVSGGLAYNRKYLVQSHTSQKRYKKIEKCRLFFFRTDQPNWYLRRHH